MECMECHANLEKNNPSEELCHLVRTHSLFLEAILKRNSRSHKACLYKLTHATIDFLVTLHQTQKKWDSGG